MRRATSDQNRCDLVAGPDRYPVIDRARDAIVGSSGQDLGDELRRQAESLAYRAAKDYELALRRIESSLVAATDGDSRLSDSVRNVAIDIVRTHMVRGLLRAQSTSGDHMAFWVQR